MDRVAWILPALRSRAAAARTTALVVALVAGASVQAGGGGDIPGFDLPPPPVLPAPPAPNAPTAGPASTAPSSPPSAPVAPAVPEANKALPSPVIQASQILPPAPKPPPIRKPSPKAASPMPSHLPPDDALPPPRPLPIGLPSLPGTAPGPKHPPSAADVEQDYAEFVDQRIDPRNTLEVVVGRQTLLVLKMKPTKVQLPGEKVAAYEQVTPSELAVTGKAVGSTVLNLWFPDPRDTGRDKILSYLVRVVPDPEDGARREAMFRRLQDEINAKFPDSVVRLTLVNDKLLVCGQAKDGFEAQQILRVVGVCPGQTPRLAADNVNLNVVNVNAGPNAPPSASLGDYLVETPTGEKYAVVNLLHVPGDQQVLLRVTVAEINRTAARSIGIDCGAFKEGCAELCGAGAGATGGPTGSMPFTIDNGRCVAAVNALKNLDFARTLAEPTLTALNGQEASSQVGGRFPVPALTGAPGCLQGTSFVPFGVQLKFTPTITDKDLIRLAVSAEVSTRDPDQAANIGNTSVPGLNTRNFQTTVELRAGQTLAVAGLIQNNFGAEASRTPLFGDLPVVGRLFSFDRTVAGEQELIVLITPELVHPLDKGECPPLPGADVFEPGDLEFYLMGRLESRRPYDFRSPVMTDLARDARYRHCEQLFIFGPQGYSDGKP